MSRVARIARFRINFATKLDPHLEGRETRQSPSADPDQIRTRRQSQGRQGAQSNCAAIPAYLVIDPPTHHIAVAHICFWHSTASIQAARWHTGNLGVTNFDVPEGPVMDRHCAKSRPWADRSWRREEREECLLTTLVLSALQVLSRR
jgi:hypothetical protein